MKKFLSLLILTALFTSCVSMPNDENIIKMDGLELNADCEMLDMRVLFYHASTSISRTSTSVDNQTNKSSSVTTTTKTYSAGHPLCVNLGNNILVDIDGNVFLSVLGHYNLLDSEKWSIEYRNAAIFGYKISSISGYKIAERKGGIVNIEDNASTIKLGDDIAIIGNTSFSRTSVKFERSVMYNDTEYNYSSNIPIFDRDRSIQIIDEHNLNVDGIAVTKDGNEIVFDSNRGFFSNNNLPSRIVNNNGVIEIYNNVKTLYVFNKEILKMRIIKTNEGYEVYTRGPFGIYDKMNYYINANRIEYKTGLFKNYYEING